MSHLFFCIGNPVEVNHESGLSIYGEIFHYTLKNDVLQKTGQPISYLRNASRPKSNQVAFEQQEFIDYANKNLILLMVDYAPYHDKEAKMDLSEIEDGEKIPKEL